MELEQTITIFLYKGKKESCQGEKIKTKKRKPIRDYMLKREGERETESFIAELRAPKQKRSRKTPTLQKRVKEYKETYGDQRNTNNTQNLKYTWERFAYTWWSDLTRSSSFLFFFNTLSLSLSLSLCLFLCVREKRTKTEKMFLYDFPFV